MKLQQLGNTDIKIPPIVFGGNVLGWTLNEKESFKMLDHLFEVGFNTIDTANSYSHWTEGNSGGESETIIGRWMEERGNRNEISQAGVALAWLINKPLVTAPIASATNEHQLEAFEEAVDTELSKEDMQQLDEASSY